MNSRISIGMPVRNGGRFVALAIRSIQSQSYQNWRLTISDNASVDETAAICEEFAAQDERISVVRQGRDIGAVENFQYLLNQARDEFFVWVAADDLWKSEFLSTCISALVASPETGLAFTGIENIDANGQVVREYPELTKLSGAPNLLTISRFILQPEILGKANLIYGVYRTSICRNVMHRIGFQDCWGSDMVFVLGVIATAGVHIHPSVQFQKRLDAVREAVPPLERRHHFLPGDGVFPLDAYTNYRASLLNAVGGTGFGGLTRVLMAYRFLHARLSARIYGLWTRNLARRT